VCYSAGYCIGVTTLVQMGTQLQKHVKNSLSKYNCDWLAAKAKKKKEFGPAANEPMKTQNCSKY